MISFCCGFYPWYREHDRSEEIFNVLIAGLNTLKNVEDIELVVVSAAVIDVWNYSPRPHIVERQFNSYKFEERIKKSFKGKVKYMLDEGSIHWEKGANKNIPRYWVSKSFQTAVNISSNDYIVLAGIDCYFTDNFISDYFDRVGKGKSWVIMSTSCEHVNYIELYKRYDIPRKYYTAKGLVGIYKKDFYKIGGWDCSKIKDKVDSNFYDRLEKSDIKITEEYVRNVYHVFHPGSHMSIRSVQSKGF